MLFAIVLIVLIVGSVLFHFLSPWWLTPIASNWGMIDDTINITFWVTGFVFVSVNLFMAYAVVRFRYRKDRKAQYQPENKKLELWLTGLTAVGVAAMLAPGLFVWAQFVDVPEDADVVEAAGQQWHWTFRFPGKDGELGKVDNRYITAENPFGMSPNDPKGQDDIVVNNNEVHLPLDRPVKILLRSKDVLHNFAVAEFRVKMDLVPGLVSYLWFTPTRTGTFDLLCEELCGIAHYTMRGKVVIDEEPDYQAWLAQQPTYAETLAQGSGDAVAGKPLYAACGGCHGALGEGNQALNAPKLAGQSAWYLKRQLRYFQEGVRGAHEQDVFGQQMAPMAAILADRNTLNNVVAYIEGLPDDLPKLTVSGDMDNGKRLYATCGACHGQKGEGRYALNSPKISRQLDWYLVRQLQNFQQGVRGYHLRDSYGPQMVSMAKILTDKQAVNDVVFYISSLK